MKLELNFIETKDQLPEQKDGSYRSNHVAVLVENEFYGPMFGYGTYNFDNNMWTYYVTGFHEHDDNDVFAWAYLPEEFLKIDKED